MQKFHSVLLSPLLSLSLSQSCSSSWGQTTPDVIAWVNTIYGFNSLHWLSGAIYHPLLFFFFFSPYRKVKWQDGGKTCCKGNVVGCFLIIITQCWLKQIVSFPVGMERRDFLSFVEAIMGKVWHQGGWNLQRMTPWMVHTRETRYFVGSEEMQWIPTGSLGGRREVWA